MRDSSVITTVRPTVRPSIDSSGRLHGASRVATGLWLAVSAVNLVVWLMVTIISGSVDGPWFLWSVAAGGVVVLGLRFADRTY